jgi:hypothetical protein
MGNTTEHESKPDLLRLSKQKGEDAPRKQQKVIQENLARFARLPASRLFEFVRHPVQNHFLTKNVAVFNLTPAH